MNRRELLKLFGFAGIALALPKAITSIDEYYVSPPYTGLPYVKAFTACGSGKVHRPAEVGIRRIGQEMSLVKFGISPYGGNLEWIARPGDEIIVPDFAPIEVWSSDPMVRAYALVKLPGIDQYEVLET